MQDTLVNTVSIVPSVEIDINQENIYMLVNVDYRGFEYGEQNLILTFDITAVQQRDTRPQLMDNKLLSDSNYIDNMNETASVLIRFLNQLSLQNNLSNIEVQSITNILPRKKWNRNNLDGHYVTVELSVPNSGSSC